MASHDPWRPPTTHFTAAGSGHAQRFEPDYGSDDHLVGAAILVIDDDPLDGTWVERVLTDAAHSVEVVVDPVRGYERACSGDFDLVLLDALMPGIEGVELCTRFQRDAAAAATPVVFLTADDSTDLHLRALRAGAVDLLIKPVAPEVLVARLDLHLRRAHQRRVAQRRRMEEAVELSAFSLLVERDAEDVYALLDAVPVPLASCARDGTIRVVNLGFASLLGVTPDQLAGRALAQLAPAPIGQELARLHSEAIEGGVVVTGEVTVELPQRHERDLEIRVEPVSGGLGAVVITVQDMTLLLDELRQLEETATDLSQAQRIGGLGSWTHEVATGRSRWSQQTHRMLGIPADQTPTVELFRDLLHPEDRDATLAAWDTALSGGRFDVEHRVVTDAGERWLRSVGEVQYDRRGDLERIDGTLLDVTASRLRSDRLERERARFSSVLDALGAVALEWDQRAGVFRVLRGDLPLDLADAADGRLSLRDALELVHAEDRRAVLDAWRRISIDGLGEAERVCRLRADGDAWRSWRLYLRAPEPAHANPVVIIAVELETVPRAVAGGTGRAGDPLTGLADRAGFMQQLAGTSVTARDNGRDVIVACIDIDRFSEVNATYGQQVGDDVLRRIAHRLQSWKGGRSHVARLEADQFAVTVQCDARNCDTEQLLAGLRAAVGVLPTAEAPTPLTASIGIARSDRGSGKPSPGRLLQRAEQARIAAKRRGLNQTKRFDSGEEAAIVRRSRRDVELEQAAAEGQFRLWFQPQIQVADGHLTGFEALLRWQHPSRGLLPPAAFIDDLERSALAQKVGWWVLSQALAQRQAWAAAGWPLQVSVNLGAAQVNDTDLSDRVAQTLADHPQFDPEYLELELLETLTIEHVAGLAANITALQQRGVRVALDDFGVGSSSLSLLHRLGVDTVKVDRSFVMGLPDDPDLKAMVSTIVALAQRFDADVVAEGVETERHLALVRELGCRRAQGYAIARPMPAEEVLGWIAARQVEGG